MRYESGSIYKPQTRDFHLTLREVSDAEAKRPRSIWEYWGEDHEESVEVAEEQLHPDHFIAP